MDAQMIVDSVMERRMATVPVWFLYSAVSLGVATVGVLFWIASIGLEMKLIQVQTAQSLLGLTASAQTAGEQIGDHEGRLVRIETLMGVKNGQ